MMKFKKQIGRVLFMMGVFSLMMCTTVFAADSGVTGDIAQGLSYIGAALSTGIAAIGGGIAVGAGAPAAIGALTEDPKSFGKSLIFVALGEGIALYGMLISILILNG